MPNFIKDRWSVDIIVRSGQTKECMPNLEAMVSDNFENDSRMFYLELASVNAFPGKSWTLSYEFIND